MIIGMDSIMMKVHKTELDGVLIIEPDVFADKRGYLMESYQRKRYADAGLKADFVQDNLSFSKKGTLRGLHYQYPKAQAKLVQVIQGEVFDVVVDIRRGSPTFGRWINEYLSDKNKRQIFVPEGFAHGFCVLSNTSIFHYKCSDFYAPKYERGIIWSDPAIGIKWPITEVLLSDKDRKYRCLKDIPNDHMPEYMG
jgi:dTDP-4-dehydrorhamnose 3,5-epimerase